MKTPEKIIKEEKSIFQIKIGKDIYIVDEYFYRKLRQLRSSLGNMKQTIKNYTERVILKAKYIEEIYVEIKKRFKKQIKK